MKVGTLPPPISQSGERVHRPFQQPVGRDLQSALSGQGVARESLHTERMAFIGLSLTLIGILIIAQMVRIQTSPAGQRLKEKMIIYEQQPMIVTPERGLIYDRWGKLLAGNREVYEVGINLQEVRNPQTIAAELSELLNLDYAEVLKTASIPYDPSTAVYIPVAHNVSAKKIALLQEKIDSYQQAPRPLKKQDKNATSPSLSGVTWRPYMQRSYPERTLASNVLGFVPFLIMQGAEAHFGIEESYDDLLKGTPVEITLPVDPNKIKEIPIIPSTTVLILTIDLQIQAMTEQILDDALAKNGAASGTIVIMDPKTGEILAMATTPRMDLNKYWQFDEIYPGNTPFNRAIGQTYEPGSVFKVLTMASALDSGAVKPDTTFLDTGSFYIGGYTIYNWNRGAWGLQDMTGCMQHSLNVCLSWVATQVGTTRFYEYLRAFGIGHRTHIDLAGEVNFPLSDPSDERWADVNLATNSFGQGVAVTPIQMVTAISALANKGRIMTPHVVKAIIDNGIQRETPIRPMNRPISSKTARQLSEMLANSLELEASNALVPGYRVAGKTGTGEIPSPEGYTKAQTNASFAGWGPVDDPRFLVYIWFERPQSSIWGSEVAAPVFSELVSKLVVLMNIPPDEVRSGLK